MQKASGLQGIWRRGLRLTDSDDGWMRKYGGKGMEETSEWMNRDSVIAELVAIKSIDWSASRRRKKTDLGPWTGEVVVLCCAHSTHLTAT